MLRKVSLDGPGALDLVNTIVTRDVSTLSPGRIAYGALCDERGKMVDDCTAMMRTPDSVRFCGANDRDYEIFTAKAADTSIDVREVTDATPHLCLQGPKSREILQGMTSSDLSNAAFRTTRSGRTSRSPASRSSCDPASRIPPSWGMSSGSSATGAWSCGTH